jgi:hypothetical protein
LGTWGKYAISSWGYGEDLSHIGDFTDRELDEQEKNRDDLPYFLEKGISGRIGGSITSSDSSVSSFEFASCPFG